MSEELLDNLMFLVREQLLHVHKHLSELRDEHGEAYAFKAFVTGAEQSEQLMSICKGLEINPEFVDLLVCDCWPLAALYIDLMDGGQTLRKDEQNVWHVESVGTS